MARSPRMTLVEEASVRAAETVHLTPALLAARLGKTTKTLAEWRYLGTGPAYLKLNGTVRYRLADVEAWEQANRQEPAA